MPNHAVDEKTIQQPPAKGKAERLHTYLGVTSTGLGILGVIGTGTAWLVASFYTGTVVIQSEIPLESVQIKVYSMQGHESVYHSRSIKLMPGEYHLDVILPNGKTKHFDTTVKFNETTAVTITAPAEAQSDAVKKKKWWQFWKPKKNDDGSVKDGARSSETPPLSDKQSTDNAGSDSTAQEQEPKPIR